MRTVLTSDADILANIEAFCERHEMKPTTFGRLAIGDGNLVSNLKAERSLTLKTAHRVLSFMSAYRPDQQAAA